MPRRHRPLALILIASLASVGWSCGKVEDKKAPPPRAGGEESKSPAVAAPPSAIPSENLGKAIEAHLAGLGHMERYEYGDAVSQFRKVRELAPDWVPGAVNLAIALFNDTGVKIEEQKKGGAAPSAPAAPAAGKESASSANFEEALALFAWTLGREPGNLHAHYGRGILFEYDGRFAEANKHFKLIIEKDPSDAYSWYHLGSTMTDPDDPAQTTSLALAKLQVPAFEKALELAPYLPAAYYRLNSTLQLLYATDKGLSPEERSKIVDRRKQLLAMSRKFNRSESGNPQAHGDAIGNVYGEAGKYALIINPAELKTESAERPEPIRWLDGGGGAFALPEGAKWAKEASDAPGSEAVSAFDADGDGKLDLFLAGAIEDAQGVRDALFLNRGDGKFEDASAAWGLPRRASLGAAAGDFDADRRIDLFLTGKGSNILLRNIEGKRFEDVTEKAGIPASQAVSPTARWLDLDQDGDLDLYVVNRSRADDPAKGVPNSAFRNDGVPAKVGNQPSDNFAPVAVNAGEIPSTEGLSLKLTPWPDAEALGAGEGKHASVAALDIDDDRDIDLVVLDADGPGHIIRNDRLGRFRLEPFPGEIRDAIGLLVADLDSDGLSDLAAVRSTGEVVAWRNATERGQSDAPARFVAFPAQAKGWRSAVAADFDLDGRWDLVGLGANGAEWARNLGDKLQVAEAIVAGGPGDGGHPRGSAFVDLAGDALPDLLLLRDGEPPSLAVNGGNGNHWLALDLGGRWKTGPDAMRTNSHGIGTRLVVRGPRLEVPLEWTTPDAGRGQSVTPAVIGMGKVSQVPLLSLKWPDGVMQGELNLPADQRLDLAEKSRKVGSCPVLFTWDGRRYRCIGDFLGGGGLGYLVAPGVYGQPDRDESVAIAGDLLKPVGGRYRISINEPMDEAAYLDHLVLEVIDHPPGVRSTPDERFAPEGPRPTGEPIAWRRSIEYARAEDHAGRDLTETLRNWDRACADGFSRLKGWTGYAEEHSVALDFADRLAGFGPEDRLVLCLAGWVEYPYSQTNYAAATAGVALKPPVIERKKPDGSWEVIEANPGYPAGMPRMMTVDLTGKLGGESCTIRLRTNMECYWDQAFVAAPEADPGLRISRLQVAKATLGWRGYTREVSPDGQLPLLYDYDYVDPAPLAKLAGRLTRYGDVTPLLADDDDRLCVVGPGDEAKVEFDAAAVPGLPEGWTRSYVLRSYGYCKDADPFTNTSDDLGPLPWKGMGPYPFGPEGGRPQDAAYRRYLDEYQTREERE